VTAVGETLLGQYYLRELIDSGGMADVYLAWDQQRSARMAVKVLRRDLSRNASVIDLFRHEAEILRKLEHPNIVRFYEFGCDREVNFIVMDWVEGGNLAQLIQHRQKSFFLSEVIQILEPICSALQFAHRSQIYHCDVKPANIMLHEDGRVLLTDFGIARLAGTGDGVDGGTPPYMAPEQFESKPVDARTDVYALGVTIYEMLAGKLPFRGDSSYSKGSTLRERIEWEHRFLPVPPLRQVNPAFSVETENLVTKAMNKEMSQRFPSVIAMTEAIHNAARLEKFENKNEIKTVIASHFQEGNSAQPLSGKERGLSNIHSSLPVANRANQSQPVLVVSGPSLYCRQGVLAGKLFSIPAQGLIIGRGSNCHIRINEASVSRRHAVIEWGRLGKIYLRDDGSSLGTFVNGYRIMKTVLLKEGDIIKVGHSELFEFLNK